MVRTSTHTVHVLVQYTYTANNCHVVAKVSHYCSATSVYRIIPVRRRWRAKMNKDKKDFPLMSNEFKVESKNCISSLRSVLHNQHSVISSLYWYAVTTELAQLA